MPSLRCLRRPRCRRGSGKSIRYDADHDQDRTREGDQVHVLSAPFNQPSNAYGQHNSGRRDLPDCTLAAEDIAGWALTKLHAEPPTTLIT